MRQITSLTCALALLTILALVAESGLSVGAVLAAEYRQDAVDKAWARESLPYDRWHRPGARPAGIFMPATSDAFGYRLTTPAYSWIEASSGAEVSFSDPDDGSAGPFDIGFDFKFYEFTYNQFFIGTNGFVSFSSGSNELVNQPMPRDPPPNALAAPFWDDLDVSDGKVYYQYFADAAGDYLVVQWEQVVRYGETALVTFELVLHENGDLVFQYKDLTGVLDQCVAGIEDGDGMIGLMYLYKAPGLASESAVGFDYPSAASRAKAFPAYQGGFALNREAIFEFKVRNTGDAWPNDTYDLAVASSNSQWAANLFAADGYLPLADTDSDGKPDTGSVQQGAEITLTLRTQASPQEVASSYTVITVTVTSSRQITATAVVNFQSAIPAPFVQAYADGRPGIFLDLIWEQNRVLAKAADFFTGNTLALTGAYQGSYGYTWEKNGTKSVGNQTVSYSELEFISADRFGRLTFPVKVLTDNQAEATPQIKVDARLPAMASLPDGKIGLIWVKSKFSRDTFKYNWNVFFGALSSSGQWQFGPVNVTQNEGWRGSGDLDIPEFTAPRITATSDNRFVLAWVDQRTQAGGDVSNVTYAVYDSDGVQVEAPALLTHATPGGDRFMDPCTSPAASGQALLAYSIATETEPGLMDYAIGYGIVNSQGNVTRAAATLAAGFGWRCDAARFVTGNMLVAWTNTETQRVAFSVLSGAGDVLSSPADLPLVGDRLPDYVSVTHDQEGHVILTWMDVEWRDHLYYALVDAAGELLTPTMIFATGQSLDPLIQSSFTGQGNAPYGGTYLNWLPFVRR